jgi:Methyltransferase domain
MFGWVVGAPQRFLVDWLPGVALEYPHQPMRVVEVGTFLGSTARGLIVLSGGGQITCIDNMMDVHYAEMGLPSARAGWEAVLSGKSGGADLSSYAKLIEGDSFVVGAAWTDPIDLLLVDAAHDYRSAFTDMRNFARWVVPGGYCLVDDYNMTDVANACRDYFLDKEWETVRQPASPDPGGDMSCYRRR